MEEVLHLFNSLKSPLLQGYLNIVIRPSENQMVIITASFYDVALTDIQFFQFEAVQFLFKDADILFEQTAGVTVYMNRVILGYMEPEAADGFHEEIVFEQVGLLSRFLFGRRDEGQNFRSSH